MLRFRQLHRKGGSKLLSKAIQHGGGIEPYITGQTGSGIEPYITGQTGTGKGDKYEIFTVAKRAEEYPDENVIYDDPNWKDIMIEKVATGIYCLEHQPPEIKAAIGFDYTNTMDEYKNYLDSDTTEDLERTYSTMADLFRNEDYKLFDIRKEVVKVKVIKKGKKNPDEVKIVDNRTPKEKRLEFREKAAKEVLRQKGRFITTRDAMIRMKKEYLTSKTKNDLPIHYSIIEKIPQQIREMRRGLKIKFKEFKDAYKLFKYHDDIAFKNNYGPRYDLKMNYSATKKEMNSLYKKLKVSKFLKKDDDPQSIPKVEEVKEVIEEIKDDVDENKMPSKTKINEMAIILNVTPKDLAEMYKNKINSNKKENEIEEVKEPEIKEEIKDEPEISSNLVKFSISKMQEKIAKLPQYTWWSENNGEFVSIAKGSSHDEADKIMREKVAAKPKKYVGKKLISMYYFFSKKEDAIHWGPINFVFHPIIVKEKLHKNMNLNTSPDHSIGPICFSQKWLEYNGFKLSYIHTMLSCVLFNKVKLGPYPTMFDMDVYKYTSLFKKKKKSKSIEKPIEKPIEVPVVKEPEIKGSDKLSDVVAKGLSIDDIVKKLLEMKNS